MSDIILRVGRVVEVSGSRVIGELEGTVEDLYRTYRSRRYAVGQVGSIVKIEAGDNLVFGFVTALRMAEVPGDGKHPTQQQETRHDLKWLEIELFGEGQRVGLGESDFDFQRGVVSYPLPGHAIYVATHAELSRIYSRPEKSCLHIGFLSQEAALPAYLLPNDLLGKHFAVLGTTGSGKSCTVAVLLRSILEIASQAHIILLDPHNEYGNAFHDVAELIDPTILKLPHWLLNFEESTELFIGKTQFVATSQTNILKDAMLHARKQLTHKDIPTERITVDTPVPYKLGEVYSHVDNAKPEQPSKQEPYKKILEKINLLRDDRRFSFLMSSDEDVTDNLVNTISRFLRIPVDSKPLSIIDLSGVPSEVVDVVVSVLCRIIFDFAVWSQRPTQVPVVLLCEEAHRYAPRRSDASFQPTKAALSRIAKEGRKYGVGLGLVSQRPSELADAILSQCNTIIALRMSNADDQNFVKSALPDSIQSLIDVLPTLRAREALVVGEGTVVPVRLRFNDLPEDRRPHSSDVQFSERWTENKADEPYIEEVVKRWRNQERPEAEESD